MKQIKRTVPVRAGFGWLAAGVVLVNAILPAWGIEPASDEVIKALLAFLAVLVAGDSYRPSGYIQEGKE